LPEDNTTFQVLNVFPIFVLGMEVIGMKNINLTTHLGRKRKRKEKKESGERRAESEKKRAGSGEQSVESGGTERKEKPSFSPKRA